MADINNKILSLDPEHFKKLLAYGKRYDGTEIQELIYHPYIFVKSELPSLLTEGNFEAILIKFNVSLVLKISTVMEIILWTYDQLNKIAELETNFLSTPPETDMVNAGIETLNELGEYNTIDMLVREWGVYTHEEIEQMPYYKIFNKQRKMKLEGDIQKNLIRIQKEKSKNKR